MLHLAIRLAQSARNPSIHNYRRQFYAIELGLPPYGTFTPVPRSTWTCGYCSCSNGKPKCDRNTNASSKNPAIINRRPLKPCRCGSSGCSGSIYITRSGGIGIVPGQSLALSAQTLMALLIKCVQLSSSFWIPRFTNFYQDTLITPVAEISTLRLYVPVFGETVSELSIFSDMRSDSVLSGFSVFGGLWTALSGTFALLFGGSLFHFLRGMFRHILKSIEVIKVLFVFRIKQYLSPRACSSFSK